MKLKRKKCDASEDFLSSNPNKSEKVTWNYLLQGHCPLPYVKNKFKKQHFRDRFHPHPQAKKYGQNLLRRQYHQFLIIEFQPNRMQNMEVITASQAKHIYLHKSIKIKVLNCNSKCHTCGSITNFNHYLNGSDRQSYCQSLLLKLMLY